MMVNKGYKYCVASVYVNCLGESSVSYYAFQKGPYGVHLTTDMFDECVCWYDTEKEALKQMHNACDCVVSMHTDYIPKYNVD